MLKWYSDLLIRNPLSTKMVTSGTISLFGDAACQTLENRGTNKGRDWFRTAKFGAIGLLYMGPILHFNYSKVLTTIVPVEAGKIVTKS